MNKSIKIFAAIAIAASLLPIGAQAQGVVGGAAAGAQDGGRAAGPVGAIVGGVGGAVVGGVAGLLGVDQRPRFRDYATRQRHQSYVYDRPVAIGGTLPGEGVTYYEVPAEYGVQGYRYTIINDHAVLVDPRTGRIVEVID